jgi:hypothetical protein
LLIDVALDGHCQCRRHRLDFRSRAMRADGKTKRVATIGQSRLAPRWALA